MVLRVQSPKRFLSRSNRGATEISEFGVALFVLFFVFFFPLLDLIFLFAAAATQYLATNDVVAKAANQPDYPSALSTMANEANVFDNTGFALFAKLTPQGGYTGCGCDLYEMGTNVASGAVTTSGPDAPLSVPIDTNANIYELSVRSNYSVSPLINFAGIPLLASVPGLGTPITLSFAANRPVEHAGGFQTSSGSGGSGSGSGIANFSRLTYSPTLPWSPGPVPAPRGVWRTPDIYTRIAAAGQTVVSDSVIVVPAYIGSSSSGWVDTGLSVSSGQRVWLDTQAAGAWGGFSCMEVWMFYPAPPSAWESAFPHLTSAYSPGLSMNVYQLDASGVPSSFQSLANAMGGCYTNYSTQIDGDVPEQVLIGYIGSPPNLGFEHRGAQIYGDSNFINCGNTLLNYIAGSTGELSLACNFNQNGGVGQQYARVIITH